MYWVRKCTWTWNQFKIQCQQFSLIFCESFPDRRFTLPSSRKKNFHTHSVYLLFITHNPMYLVFVSLLPLLNAPLSSFASYSPISSLVIPVRPCCLKNFCQLYLVDLIHSHAMTIETRRYHPHPRELILFRLSISCFERRSERTDRLDITEIRQPSVLLLSFGINDCRYWCQKRRKFDNIKKSR